MSSCLCKELEGAIFPANFFIHAVENGVDDAVHARDVYKADHGSSAAAHLHEAALDGVGGAQLAPQVPGKAKEGQQLGQVLLQPPDHAGIEPLPMKPEALERLPSEPLSV